MSDTKNICLLVTLPPRQDRFQDNTYVFNNWYPQFPPQNNRPDSTSAENIDSPNFINIEKVYAHSSDKHQCVKFMNNPINAPKIPSLGLKFSFPIHKFQTRKLAQKILTTDMRDSKSWTEILIFNHHLSGPMKSYNEFFSYKDLFTIKFPLIKLIYYCCLSKTDNNCPIAIFCFPFW